MFKVLKKLFRKRKTKRVKKAKVIPTFTVQFPRFNNFSEAQVERIFDTGIDQLWYLGREGDKYMWLPINSPILKSTLINNA